MTDPETTDEDPPADPSTAEEPEPAFAIDLDPEDQGTADAAAESSG